MIFELVGKAVKYTVYSNPIWGKAGGLGSILWNAVTIADTVSDTLLDTLDQNCRKYRGQS